jgi:hypothetical protein
MEKYRQQIEGWKSQFTAPNERTPQGELGRQMEEGVELYEAVTKYDGSPTGKLHILEEGVDCIIGLMGVMNAVDPTINVDNLMQKKLSIIGDKYPPQKINMFKKQGLSTKQAMERCKAQFN